MPKTILFVVYPQIKLLDLAGPLQVFSDVFTDDGKSAYNPVIASMTGGELESDTPVCFSTQSLLQWTRRKIDTLIIVGGRGVHDMLSNSSFIACVDKLATRSRRVASICSGAFVLAECGLLDDRRAVTHWESCHRLRRSYPAVNVIDDSIYIHDGKYWTSAGVTTGIDMAIKMVSDDLGRSEGLSLARSLVTYFVRPGGQSQFSEPLALQSADAGGRFDELHSWMRDHLTQDLQNQILAERVSMSERTFARTYRAETGSTPAKAVESLRVDAACRMLLDSDLSIDRIAQRCGFNDDERMRRAFSRSVKVTPQDYRIRFGQSR